MRLKIVLGAVAAVVVVAVGGAIAYVSTIDFNQYRGLIAEQVKQATGRDLTIKGELKLALGLSPAVAVEEVTFANAPWGSRPQMAQIKRFEAQVALLPLISGNVNIKRLVLIDPDIVLETDAKGKGNWEFDTLAKPAAPGMPAAAAGGPGTLPTFDAVEIRNARLLYRDGKTNEQKQLTIAKALLKADSETAPLKLDIEGQLDALKFKVSGDAGSIAAMSRPGTPAPIKLVGEIADIAAFKVDGIVREPSAAKGFNVTLAAEGKELAKLAELGGQKMAAFGPFKLEARVSDDAPGNRPSISSLKAELGRTSLVLIKAEGAIRDPLDQKGIAITASVEGTEIGALSGFAVPGATLPPIPALGPFRASVRVANAQNDKPTIPELRAELGKPELIRIAIDGSVRDPIGQSGVSINLIGEAKDLQAVAAKLGTTAPVSGPMKLAAKIRDTAPKHYAVSDIAFTAAGSDLAGSATLATSGARPVVTASLSSGVLDLTKFSAADSGKAPPAGAKSDRVFSNDPLPYDSLEMADADVNFKAAKLVAANGVTIQDLVLALSIKNGVLNVKPLTAGISGGTLALEAALDANRKSVSAKIDGKSIDLGALLKSTKTSDYLDRGKSDLQIDVRGAGPSMRAVMASLNGATTVVVGEGSIDSRVFDIVGADLTKILSPLSGGSGSRSTLNCVVNRMEIKDGVANTRVMLADTSALSVVGEGAVNLGTEQIGMMLRPKSKGASVATLAPPVKVGGTLAKPSYTPDPIGTAATIAGAVGGSGVLGPVGLLGGAVLGSTAGSSAAPTCQQALAQIGAKPSVAVGSSGQPASQPATQQPQQQQQQGTGTQQQQQQPSSPTEGITKGLKGLFGR